MKPLSRCIVPPRLKRCLLAVLMLGGSLSFSGPGPLRLARTRQGWLQGVAARLPGVSVFKGVPYAAPPLGALRWKDPQPPAAWKGLRRADHFCAHCMQASEHQQEFPPHAFHRSAWTKPFLIDAREPQSENCLYLNIWTAARDSSEHRPVLVWIHGGGFGSGSGSIAMYDGSALASRGIVVVDINYRLGVFGFLALPQLSRESPHRSSGNYGLEDQIAALRWIHDNIRAFGGDPGRVTIAGQSAGAFSVNALVASPLCRGLFQGAIAESGAAMLNSPLMGIQGMRQAEQRGLHWMQAHRISGLQALRQVSADSLLAWGGASGPIQDGYVLPGALEPWFQRDRQNDVPLLTGWNRDEGKTFAPFVPILSAGAYRASIHHRFGSLADSVLRWYPASTDPQAAQSQYRLLRDQSIGIENYAWALAQQAFGHSPVYVYNFRRKLPARGDMAFFGAFHSSEIVYALDNLWSLPRPWTAADRQLARQMSGAWLRFVKTGNPNGPRLPAWPAFRAPEMKVMVWDSVSGAQPLADRPELDLLLRATPR